MSAKTRLALLAGGISLCLAAPALAQQHRTTTRRPSHPTQPASGDAAPADAATGGGSDGSSAGSSSSAPTTTASSGSGGTSQGTGGGMATGGSSSTDAPATTTAGSTAPADAPAEPPASGGPLTSDEAASQAHANAPPPNTDPSLLLERRGVEMSIGARIWVMHIPSFIVGLFAHVEPGWAGALGVAAGPEFVYRNNGLDIALSVMYVGYGAPNGFFHGVNEGPNSTEQVSSDLFGVYLTSHFLWGIRFARQFEFQIGAGIGVGYVGGNLYRSQAYESPAGSWHDCAFPGTHPECGNDNSHYSHAPTGTAYTEPSIFSGGSIPTILPWISLPQIGFHIRPHRNFDFKIEGGFALIGFYGGASLHYVF